VKNGDIVKIMPTYLHTVARSSSVDGKHQLIILFLRQHLHHFPVKKILQCNVLACMIDICDVFT